MGSKAHLLGVPGVDCDMSQSDSDIYELADSSPICLSSCFDTSASVYSIIRSRLKASVMIGSSLLIGGWLGRGSAITYRRLEFFWTWSWTGVGRSWRRNEESVLYVLIQRTERTLGRFYFVTCTMSKLNKRTPERNVYLSPLISMFYNSESNLQI
jgi:hypothetical protein